MHFFSTKQELEFSEPQKFNHNSKYHAQPKEVATQIRRDILLMVHSTKSGHPGGFIDCTDNFQHYTLKF